MSAERDHIALANVNHAALNHLLEDYARFPEWISTVAFYKAVQVVEAVFAASLGMHSNDHKGRRANLLVFIGFFVSANEGG